MAKGIPDFVQIDDPEVLAEMCEVFDRHEAALTASDMVVLDPTFWSDPRTMPFGTDHGHKAMWTFGASVHAQRIRPEVRIAGLGRAVALEAAE